MINMGSLFSGIGGLELGLEMTGQFKTIWQSEIDGYACKVLKNHWSDVPNLGDITKIEWSKVDKPDMMCGGFPCQIHGVGQETANQLRSDNKGRKAREDSAAHRSANISDPDQVRCDTEFRIAKGSQGATRGEPSPSCRRLCTEQWDEQLREFRDSFGRQQWGVDPANLPTPLSNTSASGGERGGTGEHCLDTQPATEISGRGDTGGGKSGETESRMGLLAHGFSEGMDSDRIPRVTMDSPNRTERLQCLGNAVVPQVSFFIGKRILDWMEEGDE